MNERIKEIRKASGLSQEKFGEQLGVTKTAVSKMELGTYNVTDTMVKLICSKFRVNEEWLIDGSGKMFEESNLTILEQLTKEYNLEVIDIKIIESYLKLSSDNRKAIRSYVGSLASLINVEAEIAATNEEDDIEKELNAYRFELEAEKKGKTLQASQKRKEGLG